MRSINFLVVLSAFLVITGQSLSQAPGASLTWDSNGAGAGVTDGAGAWNTTSSNWWNGAGDVAWSSSATNTDVAIFGNNNGAAGTVTVKAAGVSAGGITFNPTGSGNYTLSGGAITLTGSNPTVTANTAATIASVIAGAHGLTMAGNGTLTLTAAESYSDGTRISGGTLRLGSGGALGSSTNVTVFPTGSAAAFDLNGQSQTIGSLGFGGATATSVAAVTTGTGTLTLGGTVTYDSTNNPAGAAISSAAGGGLSLGGATRTFNIYPSTNASPELAISSPIADGGASAGIIKDKGGTLTLGRNNTFTGPVTVLAGTLVLRGNNVYSGATTISGGALFLATTGNNNIPNSPTITVGDTLAASSAVLDVTGVTGSGAFQLQSGQTLQGFGTVTGATTILSGGQVAPGNGNIGALSTGAMYLTTGSTADFMLGTSGTSHTSPGTSAQVVAGNALLLNGTLNLIDNAGANGQGAAAAGSYQIFSYTGTAAGSFSTLTGLGTTYHTKVTNDTTAKAVFADLYDYAAAAPVASPDLGTIHVNGTFPGQPLTISNTAANSFFSEGLNARFTSLTGDASHGTASVINLAGQATDNTTMRVGLGAADTTTVGLKSGTVTVDLTSNGTNSGLSNTPLGPQTINVTGNVNYYADAVLEDATGQAALTKVDATHYTLDFGDLQAHRGTKSVLFSITNHLLDPVYQDELGGSFDTSGVSDFGISGFDAFSAVGPGASAATNPSVTFDTDTLPPGSYADTLSMTPSSTNPSESANLSPIELTITAAIVPEPGTLALLGAGAIGLLAAAWRRRIGRIHTESRGERGHDIGTDRSVCRRPGRQ